VSLRVLVLGGTGMLGHKLAQVLAEDDTFVVHTTVRALPPQEFRLRQVKYHVDVELARGAAPLAGVINEVQPDVVVNAVGAIKQKKLEAAPESTFYLNGLLPQLLPFLGAENMRVVQFSTDCVFRGDRGGYTEHDRPDADDLYGRSKACGELDYAPHLTLRTSIIGFEIGSKLSLLSWLLSHPRGSTVPGFGRAIFNGLPTRTLCRSVADLLARYPQVSGVYHIGSEPISKLELLRRVNDAFGLGLRIKEDDGLEIDRSLDDSRLRAATQSRPPNWDQLIAELMADFETLPYRRVYPGLTLGRTSVAAR
jgi:dTDP-4-dehydrorhamnose reductase